MIIACELARRFVRGWSVILYGQRGPGQKRHETADDGIEFKRFTVFRKPHALLEVLAGILSYYIKRRVNLFLLPVYHSCYALRVAYSIRASKCEAVLVLDFLQVASVIKLLNPSATVCLQMHCEWLTQYATTASERRLRTVDLIFGCSDYITERIRKRFPAIATRCHTVHNGVDTNFFCPSPAEPVARDVTEDLLYVGRMSPEKGVHVLIQAFKILAESRPLLRLHLVGPASMLPYLTLCPDQNDAAIASLEAFYGNRLSEIVSRQISRKNNSYLDYLAALAAADQRIIFHGAVSHRETIDFYRRADMLVFPSVGNETFGVPPIEAMACGLPIVSTYADGIPEIVEHGQTELLVARCDVSELVLAIGQLLDNPARTRHGPGRKTAGGRGVHLECLGATPCRADRYGTISTTAGVYSDAFVAANGSDGRAAGDAAATANRRGHARDRADAPTPGATAAVGLQPTGLTRGATRARCAAADPAAAWR